MKNSFIYAIMVGNPESTDFRIKYGVVPDEINANTLLKSLSDITRIIEEINNEVGEGQKLDIMIKAPEKGSFLIHLKLIAAAASVGFIGGFGLESAAQILKFLIGILKLRQVLGGEKPREITEIGDDFKIKSKSGSQITINKNIYNTYNNNYKIGQLVADNFENLNTDSSIASFEIQDIKHKSLFHSGREEFEMLSVKETIEAPSENTRIQIRQTRLYILKLVFDRSRKWDFFYMGVKISAKITDANFWGNINKGEDFSNGDSLEVDLQINQIFNESANTFENKLYEVVKIHRHIRRPNQEALGLTD